MKRMTKAAVAILVLLGGLGVAGAGAWHSGLLLSDIREPAIEGDPSELLRRAQDAQGGLEAWRGVPEVELELKGHIPFGSAQSAFGTGEHATATITGTVTNRLRSDACRWWRAGSARRFRNRAAIRFSPAEDGVTSPRSNTAPTRSWATFDHGHGRRNLKPASPAFSRPRGFPAKSPYPATRLSSTSGRSSVRE